PASSGRDSQVVQPTLVHAGNMPLPKSLAFVNRSAEAFDVLFANLQSEHIVARDEVVKLRMPLASQPPGTGKTLLGKNLIAVLRRPREDAALEERVAARLATAWCWGAVPASPASIIAAARADPRDENLVVRTLLRCF